MRANPDKAANSVSVITYRITPNRNVALIWLQNSREYTYSRGFTCTIRSQKTKDFTLVDGERNAIDSFVLIEAFMKVIYGKKNLSHDYIPL